jgi:GNAT superfamily N-acetyltransferase
MRQFSNSPTGITIRLVQTAEDWRSLHWLKFREGINLFSNFLLIFPVVALIAFLVQIIFSLVILTPAFIHEFFENPSEFLALIFFEAIETFNHVVKPVGFILPVALILLDSLTYLDRSKRDWIVVDSHGAIAYASMRCKNTYSELARLYVHPRYRRRGIGSRLVRHLADVVTKPIYVFPASGTRRFYIRLGFRPVSPDEIHREMAGGVNVLLILT